MSIDCWKDQLATVWQAATIQRKLKKSQYVFTNIHSSVDLIIEIFPSLPFPMRESARLLLGVVRIHSKQVEYLLQNYKALDLEIRKVILCTNVNLAKGTAHLPYHSISLPDIFELDAFNLNDDNLDLNRFEDAHIQSYEEITLEDQIIAHEDQYATIHIDEDIGKISKIEFMLDAIHDRHSENVPLRDDQGNDVMESNDNHFENVPQWEDQWNDIMEPDEILEEMIMKDKETASVVVEEMMQCDEPPSPISAGVQEITNPQISFGYQSLDLVLQSTPPPEEPKPRRRRRKLLIDAVVDIVLTEDETNPLLIDTGTFKCRRKNAPLSSLDISKLNKRRRKDGMLFEPLLTGLCDELCNIFNEDFISEKIKKAYSHEEDHTEPSGNNSPPLGNDFSIEIERLRDNQDFAFTDLLSEISPSPNKFISSPPMSTSSPSERDDFTPSTCYIEGPSVENTIQSDIHEFDSSAEVLMQDLSFLDRDDRTPIDELGETPEFDTLPTRTRTVARFFQEKSQETPISEGTGDLSLNTILEGKNKKICARMFYETLVLENCGLVNVNQNIPYGDITLKVTSRLKEQLSS